MKRVSLILLPCLLVVVLAGLFLRPTFVHGAAASPVSCGKGWSVVPSANRSNYSSNELFSVAAISATDVWAVGGSWNVGKDKGLVEHWNGTAWSIVPDASPKNGFGIDLSGIAAVATNDVWAVGYDFIEHWNGTSWSVVANPGGRENLAAVAAISSNNVWAVGSTIIHWDGTAWSVVPHPSHEFLFGITAVSSTDVWAVGNNYNTPRKGVIEHWDGKSWTIVASPTPTIVNMYGVAAASATDIWAVGSSGLTKGGPPEKIRIEHWNGTKWTLFPVPNQIGTLSGVDVVSENNIWAVGSNSITSTEGLILHWNGTKWNLVPSPNPGQPLTVFNAVMHAPGTTQAWTIGYIQNDHTGVDKTLTEYYC